MNLIDGIKELFQDFKEWVSNAFSGFGGSSSDAAASSTAASAPDLATNPYVGQFDYSKQAPKPSAGTEQTMAPVVERSPTPINSGPSISNMTSTAFNRASSQMGHDFDRLGKVITNAPNAFIDKLGKALDHRLQQEVRGATNRAIGRMFR